MAKSVNTMTKKECMEELNVNGIQYKAKASLGELRSLVEFHRIEPKDVSPTESVTNDSIPSEKSESDSSASSIANEIITKPVKNETKTEKQPSFQRERKVERMTFMENLIGLESGWRLNALVELTYRYFPDTHPETLRTNLYDGQNEKYNPFSRALKIIKEENRGRVVYFA